ncbi:TnsA-like heteromeric transposase endonuclease subunit [Mycobacterium avium]|uniref:TnsA-like heteromeric transposase endonuclease subunit n=1 Tax=Mycobacterium avium TaxID=1764 RepID=UPI001CC46DBA|nr:TnsA-like heteromeric transposase endonuclease subunit [Mycobacterium avium]MBZ4521883.1 TnsA-like heteromeric transposase endonuclease subunit [Mycobacterium avium subsp. hominissuis]MBZ4531266.1 TnsA-like heteromeric transposase endonuclease subunit [Mycobacterium avium subsp. hominissuis]
MNSGTSTEVRPGDEPAAEMRWFMRFHGGDIVEWCWSDRGAPPLDELVAIRTPRASSRNRHIPVSAYSMTNTGIVHLESGLEHDLVRRLDRDSAIRWIVAQPLRLEWTGTKPAKHTPDLLTVDEFGVVTVWDVRAVDEQDDDFHVKSRVTRDACAIAGWRYEVFSGLGVTERMNMLWLHGFRRRPPWTDRYEDDIRAMAAASTVTLGALFGADDGSDEVKPVVWHLLWAGDLCVDMNAAWTLHTEVTLGSGVRHD